MNTSSSHKNPLTVHSPFVHPLYILREERTTTVNSVIDHTQGLAPARKKN